MVGRDALASAPNLSVRLRWVVGGGRESGHRLPTKPHCSCTNNPLQWSTVTKTGPLCMKTGLWRGLRAGHRPYLYPSFLPRFNFAGKCESFLKLSSSPPSTQPGAYHLVLHPVFHCLYCLPKCKYSVKFVRIFYMIFQCSCADVV